MVCAKVVSAPHKLVLGCERAHTSPGQSCFILLDLIWWFDRSKNILCSVESWLIMLCVPNKLWLHYWKILGILRTFLGTNEKGLRATSQLVIAADGKIKAGQQMSCEKIWNTPCNPCFPAGASPNCHWAKAGTHLGQAASSSPGWKPAINWCKWEDNLWTHWTMVSPKI